MNRTGKLPHVGRVPARLAQSAGVLAIALAITGPVPAALPGTPMRPAGTHAVASSSRTQPTRPENSAGSHGVVSSSTGGSIGLPWNGKD